MKKFIYYPNLEPPDTEWLKFSLLYLDRLESIVPYDKQYLISEDYKRLLDETDLVEMYSPHPDESERASIKAVEESIKFLEKPYLRSSLFNRPNLSRDWKNQDKWNYTIFSEKFSNSFSDFVINHNIGRRNNEGLLLPTELAFIFMTHLAKEVSHIRNGTIITDNIHFDNYTNFSQVSNPGITNRHKFIKGIINILLPVNISALSFSKLIDFRNRNRERISAFNHQISILEDSIGQAVSERDFINSFNQIYSELSREIILLGIGVTSIPLTSYILTQDPNALSAEYLKEILGSVGMGIGGVYAVKKAFFDNKEARMCKKYLTNIERLR